MIGNPVTTELEQNGSCGCTLNICVLQATLLWGPCVRGVFVVVFQPLCVGFVPYTTNGNYLPVWLEDEGKRDFSSNSWSLRLFEYRRTEDKAIRWAFSFEVPPVRGWPVVKRGFIHQLSHWCHCWNWDLEGNRVAELGPLVSPWSLVGQTDASI